MAKHSEWPRKNSYCDSDCGPGHPATAPEALLAMGNLLAEDAAYRITVSDLLHRVYGFDYHEIADYLDVQHSYVRRLLTTPENVQRLATLWAGRLTTPEIQAGYYVASQNRPKLVTSMSSQQISEVFDLVDQIMGKLHQEE